MLRRTWIGVTGQIWKIYVWLTLLALWLLFLVVALILAKRSEWVQAAWSILAFFSVGMVWLGWTFFSIYCPFCRTRIVWTVLRTLPHQHSIYAAVLLTDCPNCRRSFFKTPSAAGPS
jgi:hypothetical protein